MASHGDPWIHMEFPSTSTYLLLARPDSSAHACMHISASVAAALKSINKPQVTIYSKASELNVRGKIAKI